MTDLFPLNINIKNLFPISLKLFETSELNRLQERIVFRQVRGKEVPYVRCIIRNKEIQLKPEEVVRQLFTERLINHYHYLTKHIQFEYPVSFGREKKFADIVVFDKNHPDAPYIIIETKKPKLKDGKDQLKSYCHATGAPIAVWTNGEKTRYYHRKNPNYFEDISKIPKATQSLSDIIGRPWTLEDLRKNDKLLKAHTSLKDLILEMEDEVLANAGVDVFEELFKLIFTKLYDEMESARHTKRFLEFRNDGDSDGNIYDKIQNLFTQAKQKWQGVFDNSSKLTLTASHLAICVSSLQDVKLFNSNLEVIDEAFEYLINQSAKGAKGQYFTPRYVIDLCVKMLNPKENESMIDTAAGSCGFPMHCTFHVWDTILKSQGLSRSHLFTAENKPVACSDYVTEKVFAIDFDEKAVRVARTMNLIAGDGQTNVLHLNTLDWSRWNNRIDNDWRDTYWEGWRRLRKMRRPNHNDNRQFDFDILMANPPFAGDIKETAVLSHYELAKNAKGKRQSKVGRDILFIERNLDFLKPGGRMAIVLPQGRFNNSSDAHIRKWLAEHGRILAVVGLHGNVFKPHTGTKTSVLFLQKWTDDNGINPRRDDYPIFFATMQKPSKDNSGEKIYLKDENGHLRHDKHGHLMVDHDLFNHEGLTQDGIFEAFAEFSKKEKLSFFLTDEKAFNPQRYQALLDGLEVSEVLLSEMREEDRLDAEFYQKHYIELEKILVKIGFSQLKNITKKIDVGFVGSMTQEYTDSIDGVPLLQTKNIDAFFINKSSLIKINPKFHENLGKSKINKHDILVARSGSFGKAAIYLEDKEINSSDVIILQTKKDISPFFLTTYLNTKYGSEQMLRFASGGLQGHVNLTILESLKVPKQSYRFQEFIKNTLTTAYSRTENSTLLYNQAQSLLLSELGLDYNTIQQFSNSAIAIRNLKDSFGQSGRLDAEYYQPKYDELINKIKNHKDGYKRLGDCTNLIKGIEVGAEAYQETGVPFIRVSNLSPFGLTEEKYINNDLYEELKAFQPIQGEILLSKDASPGIACYLADKPQKMIISGGVLRLQKKTDALNYETLCLILNSIIVKEQINRDVGGSVILHWRPDQVQETLVPIISKSTQRIIEQSLTQSRQLRTTAKHLLDSAKTAVEIAIEQDETKAMDFLQEQQNGLFHSK